jgi:transposase
VSVTSMPRGEVKWVGLDVAKDAIAVGVLDGMSEATPRLDKIVHDEVSIRRLVSRLGGPARLRACYEAGPTGYELHRLLGSMGVDCEVIAPSLVPVAPGDKVKTDRRDARRLVRLYRAGELVTVRVPTREEEGARDLSRLRAAAMVDRRRARQRLGSFLLRRHLVYRDGTVWTGKHRQWLRSLGFDDTASRATFGHLLASVEERELRVGAIDVDLGGFFDAGLFADGVARLGAYRGIGPLSALGLCCEVCDWRRFPAPAKFMGFVGLVPAEYSTGASIARYGITKSGNAHVRNILVEAAWAYRYPARVSPELARRHVGLAPEVIARAWNAQVRLCGRFRHLATRKDRQTVVATAIARELAGFVWAEMTA